MMVIIIKYMTITMIMMGIIIKYMTITMLMMVIIIKYMTITTIIMVIIIISYYSIWRKTWVLHMDNKNLNVNVLNGFSFKSAQQQTGKISTDKQH